MALDKTPIEVPDQLQSPAFTLANQVGYPWTTDEDGALVNLWGARRIRVESEAKTWAIKAEFPDWDTAILFRHTDKALVYQEFERLRTWILRLQMSMPVFNLQEASQNER